RRRGGLLLLRVRVVSKDRTQTEDDAGERGRRDEEDEDTSRHARPWMQQTPRQIKTIMVPQMQIRRVCGCPNSVRKNGQPGLTLGTVDAGRGSCEARPSWVKLWPSATASSRC